MMLVNFRLPALFTLMYFLVSVGTVSAQQQKVPVGNFGVQVQGTTVFFPDTDYYQVQLSSNYLVAFEGVADPSVPLRLSPGSYHIINLTKMQRVDFAKLPLAGQSDSDAVAKRLSCEITNRSIVVNGGNSMQHGKGPFRVSMNWTNNDGSRAGITPPAVTGLKAIDNTGSTIGDMSFVRNEGAHPANVYEWTVPNRGGNKEVIFTYGEPPGGQQCSYKLDTRLLSDTPTSVVTQPPSDDENEQIIDGLSCSKTNATFIVNNNRPVRHGDGQIQVKMDWTNGDGSFAGVPPVTGLKAVDSNGTAVGTIQYTGAEGSHPTNVYLWTVKSTGRTIPVIFTYGESDNGIQCAYSGKVSLLANEQPETPTTPINQPEPPYGSEITEIEQLQAEEGVLAFPGALGFARNALGGRGGRVITVNTVEDIDNPNDNLMSLREAVESEKGPRTIVFSVGGVFDTGKKTVDIIGAGQNSGSFITLACQTAPSPGVVIKTYGFDVSNAHDIVFRHCAVRGVDLLKGHGPRRPESIRPPLYQGTSGNAGRGMTVRGGSENVMLDHMSFSWATDEGFQVYVDKNQVKGTNNVTLSNSIITEGDADSSHAESAEHFDWGYHAMGPSCNADNANHRPNKCSIVNNYIAHNSRRNGMIWGGSGEISNNVVYNWYSHGVTVNPKKGSNADVIVNNNLMKVGPNTPGGNKGPSCSHLDYNCALELGKTQSSGVFKGTARYSIGDNYFVPERGSLTQAQLMRTHNHANTPDGRPDFGPATPSLVSIVNMAEQGGRHMRCIGASRPMRDQVDTRVIDEFYKGTGAVGIGENIRTGGHNQTTQRTWNIFGGPTNHPADYDKDKDGMADVWEVNYGLSDTNPNDHSGDLDNDGYTNLEEYLAIAAFCQ